MRELVKFIITVLYRVDLPVLLISHNTVASEAIAKYAVAETALPEPMIQTWNFLQMEFLEKQ